MSTDVRAVHEARVQALVNGDLETLDRCVADDLAFTTPHGTVLTKSLVFESIRNGQMKVVAMEVDDLKVCEYGGTAILTYRAATTYTDNGVVVDGTVRSTTIYLKRDERWKLVAAHQSLIRD